jgi:hypothetical protein
MSVLFSDSSASRDKSRPMGPESSLVLKELGRVGSSKTPRSWAHIEP